MAEPTAPKVNLTTQQRAEYEQLVREKAAQMGVDPDRAARFVRLESNFDPAARNPRGGAAGLFQFVPDTARSMGLDERTVFDAQANADAGLRFMANVDKDLSKRLGRQVADYEHYIGHFLGPRGAQNALSMAEKNPNMPMPQLLHSYLTKKRAEKQLKDNPELRKETVSQFIARQQSKVSKASDDLPSVQLARATPAAAAAPVAATAATTPARMNPNLQAQGQRAAAAREAATPKTATPQDLLSSASQYGPDYQAALALAALDDDDDDEEYTTKSGEPLVRARSMLDEMTAEPAPKTALADLNLKVASPFAALQPKGGGPVRLALGGVVEPITPMGMQVQSPFANSANPTVANMAGNVPRGTMPGQSTVFRAEGSPQQGETSLKDRVVGAGESAASMMSGMLGSIPAGYEGLSTLLRTGDAARAAQAVREGQERYTYQPRTEAGKREAQSSADLLEKLNVPAERVGEYALEKTGSPAAATMAQIVLDPLNFAPGPRQLASAAKGVPKMVKEAAMEAYGPAATASHVTRPYQGSQVPKAWVELSLQPYKVKGSSTTAEAVNNWIDSTLTKYVTRDLGTANDPILRKAEEGKLHFIPEEVSDFKKYISRTHQEETGMGAVAQSPLARTWETNVDANMIPTTAKDMLIRVNDRIEDLQSLGRLSGEDSLYANTIKNLNKEKAWLEKAPEDQLVHYLTAASASTELGLGALVDGVKNLINSGEIRPAQLSKLAIGDAVERIHQRDKASGPFYEVYKVASEMTKSGGPLERGVPLPKEVSQFGTAEFLPLESGYQWRRIVDPRATEVQAKMMANSISGYNKNIHSYSQFEHPAEALRNGAVELYALYDPSGRVVTHVEYVRDRKSGDKTTKDEITQVLGNGPRTGNEFPENYMEQVKQLIDKLGPKKVPDTLNHYFEYGNDFLRGGE